MLFLFCFLPVAHVYLWEDGVELRWRVVDEGEIDAMCHGKGLTVNAFTTNNENLLFAATAIYGLFERTENLAPDHVRAASAHHDVAAMGQGAVGQRVERVAPHDDGVAGGERLEVLHVVGQMVEQAVAKADSPVAGHGHDDADSHGTGASSLGNT